MEFKQVDISEKEPTLREAKARGIFKAPKEVIEKLREKKLEKGDAISCAEISGIIGAKYTSFILPLCHPINLTNVKIDIKIIDKERVEVISTVKSFSSTGVEMEALFSVSSALLCLYDFCKKITQNLKIEEIHLLEKRGGKGGEFFWKD